MPPLLLRWHVYAFDFHGHGESGRSPGRYLVRDYAEDTIAFLERQVKEPAILVGHSMGGMVSLQVASARPDLVRAVVLEDCPLYVATEPLSDSMRQSALETRDLIQSSKSADDMVPTLKQRSPDMDDAAIRQLAATLHQVDPELFASNIEGNPPWDCDLDALLAGIGCPVLLIEADPDYSAWSRQSDGDRAVLRMKGCARVQVKGVGHWVHRHAPDRFQRVLLDYLVSLELPAQSRLIA